MAFSSLDDKFWLTDDEKDAIAYFEGTGFYKYFQDINYPPNIYDTRETFLLKMHDETARNRFLKSLNRIENETSQNNFSDKNKK